ncbi:hypothetical protein DFH09DRAFT_1357575 [Mycena vulgaris]|nr:hypothetical protein DFH09DRAFT_1357575 [Mycena vulgaris]
MSSPSLSIDMIIVAAGEMRLAAYIKQTFPPEVARRGHYTVDNAADWLDVDKFARWLSQPQTSASPVYNATSSRRGARSKEEPARLPSPTPPIPYVLGFSLTASQMRTVAHTLLEQETVAPCLDDHDYHCALVEFARTANEEWAFLRTMDDGSDETRYLWVLYVVPSWDGRHPPHAMPEETVRRVKDAFKFQEVEIRCQRWPETVPVPQWLFSSMRKTMQVQGRNGEECSVW